MPRDGGGTENIQKSANGTDTMPRDGGGTENIQKSANMTAVKKRKCKKLQNRFSSSLYIHIR